MKILPIFFAIACLTIANSGYADNRDACMSERLKPIFGSPSFGDSYKDVVSHISSLFEVAEAAADHLLFVNIKPYSKIKFFFAGSALTGFTWVYSEEFISDEVYKLVPNKKESRVSRVLHHIADNLKSVYGATKNYEVLEGNEMYTWMDGNVHVLLSLNIKSETAEITFNCKVDHSR